MISAGLTEYFGTGLVQMVADAVRGISVASEPFGAAFFWVAVPAYVVWGVGLGVAALSYARRTRPPCRTCHRG